MKVLFAESHNLDRPEPLGSHRYIRLFQKEGHNCLWLGPPISPLHLFKADRLNRRRFKIWLGGGCDIEGIKWIVPHCAMIYYNLPVLRSLHVGRRQYRLCLPPLTGKLKKAGFETVDLLWCAGPAALSLLDRVPHSLSCYRLADRLDQFSRIPPNVGTLQKELIKRVDFVLATSLSLLEWAREFRDKDVYYLPNGVSESFFDPAGLRPFDFPGRGRPVVVYVGALDTRFDLQTLAFAVRNLKDLHFFIIGPVTDESLKPLLRELESEENFTLTGPREQALVPAYLQHSTAGIIPFYVNELTEAVNPLKYYEYLACGLPVVAPPLRELKAMQGPLYAYRDKEELCDALKKAVSRREEERPRLIEFAGKQTWEKRYAGIKKIIEAKTKVQAAAKGDKK